MVSAEASNAMEKEGMLINFHISSFDILCFSLPSSHIIIFQIEIILNIWIFQYCLFLVQVRVSAPLVLPKGSDDDEPKDFNQRSATPSSLGPHIRSLRF